MVEKSGRPPNQVIKVNTCNGTNQYHMPPDRTLREKASLIKHQLNPN